MVPERGSAPVETLFAIVFLLLLVLGVIEVAFALYARNVVLASAHEGARAAVEYGRDPAEARALAETTVREAAGSLVRDLDVRVGLSGPSTSQVEVVVRATIDSPGPVPFPISVNTRVSAQREALPE